QRNECGDDACRKQNGAYAGRTEPRAHVVLDAHDAPAPRNHIAHGERDQPAEDGWFPGPVAEAEMTRQWCDSSGSSRYSRRAPRAHTAHDAISPRRPISHMNGPRVLRTSPSSPTKTSPSDS